MTNQVRFFQHPFALWMAANFAGFGLLGLAVLLIPGWLSQTGLVGSILIITIPVSIAQWVVLKRLVSFSWLWIIAMPVGLTLAILLLRAIPESLWQVVDDESIPVLVAGYLVVGFMVGFPQWLLLRRRFEKTLIWVAVTAGGLSIGFGLVLLTNMIYWSEFISYVLVVLIYAAGTGYFLSKWISLGDVEKSNLMVAN